MTANVNMGTKTSASVLIAHNDQLDSIGINCLHLKATASVTITATIMTEMSMWICLGAQKYSYLLIFGRRLQDVGANICEFLK